jgi:hypothetical protein
MAGWRDEHQGRAGSDWEGSIIVWQEKSRIGATVRIHDDFMAPKGSERERRIIEEQRRVAYEILVSAAERKAGQRPDNFGFPVCIVGSRTKIPNRPFIQFMEGKA